MKSIRWFQNFHTHVYILEKRQPSLFNQREHCFILYIAFPFYFCCGTFSFQMLHCFLSIVALRGRFLALHTSVWLGLQLVLLGPSVGMTIPYHAIIPWYNTTLHTSVWLGEVKLLLLCSVLGWSVISGKPFLSPTSSTTQQMSNMDFLKVQISLVWNPPALIYHPSAFIQVMNYWGNFVPVITKAFHILIFSRNISNHQWSWCWWRKWKFPNCVEKPAHAWIHLSLRAVSFADLTLSRFAPTAASRKGRDLIGFGNLERNLTSASLAFLKSKCENRKMLDISFFWRFR